MTPVSGHWPAGAWVRLGADGGPLYVVTGRAEPDLLIVRGLDTDDRHQVPAADLVRAAAGDLSSLRHAWPLGSRVRRAGGDRVYTVVAHVPRTGFWYGTLQVRAVHLDNGPLLSLPTGDVVPVHPRGHSPWRPHP